MFFQLGILYMLLIPNIWKTDKRKSFISRPNLVNIDSSSSARVTQLTICFFFSLVWQLTFSVTCAWLTFKLYICILPSLFLFMLRKHFSDPILKIHATYFIVYAFKKYFDLFRKLLEYKTWLFSILSLIFLWVSNAVKTQISLAWGQNLTWISLVLLCIGIGRWLSSHCNSSALRMSLQSFWRVLSITKLT